MAANNQSTIHVNGLSHSVTEESIRQTFNPYGEIDHVKIVSSPGTRRNCYCFVSFKHPMSVPHAISEMNGKTIDGQVVRVTAARNRPVERSSFGRGSFRRDDAGRGIQGGRYREQYTDRSRERDRSLDRDVGRGIQIGRHDDRSRKRDRSLDLDVGRGIQGGRHDDDRSRKRARPLDLDVGKGIGYDQARDRGRARGGFVEKEEGECSDEENDLLEEEGIIRDGERERNLVVYDRDGERQRTAVDQKIADKDTDHRDLREIIQNRARNKDRTRRDVASELNDDEVKDELERSVRMLAERKKEVSQLEEELQDKTQFTVDQRERNKKLEDEVTDGKKILSQNRAQLANLQSHLLEVKECQDQLKRTEQKLESLLDPSLPEGDSGSPESDSSGDDS